MKIKVYNIKGQESGDMELDNLIFSIEPKKEVVHQVFVAQSANARESNAHVKNKGEVRGGGRKPWAQKGTGRARHGSIRSPLWRGGGATFGPRNIENYKQKINKKTRRLALKMCLSDRANNKNLWIIENYDFEQPKTKFLCELIKNLPCEKKSFLILTDKKDEAVLKMARNIPKIEVMRANDANVLAVLNKAQLMLSKQAISKLEKMLNGKVDTKKVDTK
ncbi:MAG: 50S ribosomal protein L4 [bacterium]